MAVVRSLGASRGRGALVDLGSRRQRHDALGAVVPLVGTTILSPPRYHRLHLERSGQSALLRLVGVDPAHPQVRVVTTYLLPTQGFVLELGTTVLQRGPKPLPGYRIADRIYLGATDAFLPGQGWARVGERKKADFLEAYGRDVSYAYRQEAVALDVLAGDGYLQASGPAQTLMPGQQVSARRLLAVGDGSWCAALRAPLLARRNEEPATITIAGLDERLEPLPHGIVTLLRGGRPWGLARLGEDGRTALRLAGGGIALGLSGRGRRSPFSPGASLQAAERRSIELTTGPPSQLVYDIRRTGQRDSIPLRLEIEPATGGTGRPWLGLPHELRARNTVLSVSGRGVLPLPPGRYTVTVDGGPLHELLRREVTLQPHSGASLVAHVDSIALPPGLISVDAWQPRADGWRSAMQPAAVTAWNRVAALGAALHQPPRDLHWVLTADGSRFKPRLARFLKALRAGRRAVAAAGTKRLTVLPAPYQSARSWVRTGPRESLIRAALRAGRSTLGNGAILLMEANGKGPGELVSLPKTRRRKRQPKLLTVRAQLYAPAHVLLDELQFYVDGMPRDRPIPVPGRTTGLRLDATVRFAFARDTSLLAVARGRIDPKFTGGHVVNVHALTNALWIDADGDGRWRALPGAQGRAQ